MVTAMSRVRTSLQRIAAQELASDPVSHARTLLAIARICDLDLAVMLESYKDDLVASRGAGAGRASTSRFARSSTSASACSRTCSRRPTWSCSGSTSEGRVVMANPKAEQLTGYTREELAGLDIFELLFAERAPAIRAALMAAAKAGPSSSRRRRGPGRARRARSAGTRPRTARSEVDEPTLVVVGVDVTKERELERRARHNERLAAAGALAAGLAHEIRNPLNGASLHLSVIERGSREVPRRACWRCARRPTCSAPRSGGSAGS